MQKYFKLALWIIGFQLIGLLLGMITRENIPLWYNHLIKPQATPPALVFAVVWPMLYLLLAFVGFRLYSAYKANTNATHKATLDLTFRLFVVQQLFNWTWTLLFFQWHWLGFSVLWLLVLIILNLVLIYRLWSEHRTLALLLLPYVSWLMFAGYLNVAIFVLN